MKQFIANHKYLSCALVAGVCDIGMLLFIDPRDNKVVKKFTVDDDTDKENKDTILKEQALDDCRLIRGLVVSTPSAILGNVMDKYVNQNITNNGIIQYLLTATESLLPILFFLNQQPGIDLSTYDFVSISIQAIAFKYILELDSESEIALEDLNQIEDIYEETAPMLHPMICIHSLQ